MPTNLFHSTNDLYKMSVRLVETELEDAKKALEKAGGAPEALSKIAEGEKTIKEVFEMCDKIDSFDIKYPATVRDPSKNNFVYATKFGERLKAVLQKATTQTGIHKDVQDKLNGAIADAEKASHELVGVVFYENGSYISKDYLPAEPYSHAKNQLHMAMRLVQLEFKKAKLLLPSGNTSIHTQLEAVGRLIDELVEHIPTMNYHDIPKYDRNQDNPGKTLYSNSYASSVGYKIRKDIEAILKELAKSNVQAQLGSNHTKLAKQLQMVADDANNATSSFGNFTHYDWGVYSSTVKSA